MYFIFLYSKLTQFGYIFIFITCLSGFTCSSLKSLRGKKQQKKLFFGAASFDFCLFTSFHADHAGKVRDEMSWIETETWTRDQEKKINY